MYDKLKASSEKSWLNRLLRREEKTKVPEEELYLLDFHAYQNADGTPFTGTMYDTVAHAPTITITSANATAGITPAYLTSDITNMATGMFVRSTDLPVPEEETVTKIPTRPIDVLNELEIVPDAFSMAGLADKIKLFEDKRSLVKSKTGPGSYATRDIDGVLERLRNRLKYSEHQAFYALFRNTTDAKITPFLEKHEFALKTSDLFIPEFPQPAIDIMAEYKDHTRAVSDKSPVFYVIAPKKDFRDAQGRRDPILLAQSPFGFYWQILGAWDEEMLVLSEI